MMTAQRPIAIVVAVARNGVIGRNGELPWTLRDDLKWFRKATMGKPIIMGRTTYESIGQPLPGRENIILTRQASFAPPQGTSVAASLETGLTMADSFAAQTDAAEICIIGGADIYAQAMDLVTHLYVTLVDADVEGDKTFALPPKEGWTIENLATISADDRNDHDATIMRWTRNDNV
ncbi:dihydrofolate reductase [Parvularcula sp. LCG005]|uniref:dihydrofolate reductase n=1 Tax=Parvularcula sp. LCG005 TaxID=3078805 RepID=UPI002942AC34|nr:dihydrofolate reductase [Parvularcula sp. LCG005]WOI54012.1 dihydrofolate reductase [Parvularcula sp. LCG005]